MPEIGRIPYGFMIKNDERRIFDIGDYLVYTTSEEEANRLIEEYLRNQEYKRKFIEKLNTPPTEEEKADHRRIMNYFNNKFMPKEKKS